MFLFSVLSIINVIDCIHYLLFYDKQDALQKKPDTKTKLKYVSQPKLCAFNCKYCEFANMLISI